LFEKREFELDLLAYSIKKPVYLKQHLEKLKEMKFKDPMIGLIYDQVIIALNEFKTIPTESELTKMVSTYMSDKDRYNALEIDLANEVITECYSRQTTELTGASISSYLIETEAKKLSQELLGDSDHILKNVEEYVRRMAKLKYYVTEDDDLGLDFFALDGIKEAKELLTDYNTVSCMSTGYPVLDLQLSGGLRKGELAVIIASTNMGKTSLLLNFAINFVKNDQRVIYVAIDNLKGEMISRTVGCLLEADITQGIDPGVALDEVTAQYAADKYKGKFIFKHFNHRELNKSKLERYLDKLQTYLYEKDKEAGILPEDRWGVIDVIVVDYLDVMISESKADEGWVACEHLAQEIKAVCKSRNMLCLTATQGGTEAMKADTVKLYMAQGYKSKFNAPDMVFSISQDDSEKNASPPAFRLACLKARRAKVNYQIKYLFWKEKQLIREVEDAKIYSMSERQMEETAKRERKQIDHNAVFGVKNSALEEARKRLAGYVGSKQETNSSEEETGEFSGSEET
jgi:replicative DNA helicase